MQVDRQYFSVANFSAEVHKASHQQNLHHHWLLVLEALALVVTWTMVMKGEAGLKGSFEWVRESSTTPTILKPQTILCRLGSLRKTAVRAGSKGLNHTELMWNYSVGLVQSDSGSSKVELPGQGTRPEVEFHINLGWFNPTKPPQTCSHHSKRQGTRPVVELHIFVVVQPYRPCSNHGTGQGTRPVVELDMSSGWFNSTEPSQTCSNHSTGQGTGPVVEFDMSSEWFNSACTIERGCLKGTATVYKCHVH